MSNSQTLPMRFRMLEIMADGNAYTVASMLEALKGEYQGEGQFNDKVVSVHFDSARAVGLIDVAEAELDAAKNLTVQYKITDYGRERLIYIPAK